MSKYAEASARFDIQRLGDSLEKFLKHFEKNEDITTDNVRLNKALETIHEGVLEAIASISSDS